MRFHVLLLFVGAMLAAVQAGDPSDLRRTRLRILGLGSVYIASIFLTYLALGAGWLSAGALFSRYHMPARIAALAALGLGLWMLKDVLVPEWGPPLTAPRAVAGWAVEAARRMTLPAMVTGGFLIGLCTVPCSGAIYLAILALLALQPSRWLGFAYLVLYNVMFILPLVGLLIAASARPTLRRLARWNRIHHDHVRLAMGVMVIGVGLWILATV